MGQVWLAWDQRLNEDVALKFLPHEIRHDLTALDDMRRETLKSRKLSHPNIVRIYDLFEGEGELPFISMEFIEGATLANLKAGQPDRCFTWDQVKPWAKQLCEALEYAHGEGVVHRDLKPGNIMLDGKGRLKLADFGIAATISESTRRVTAKQQAEGTLAYMSPQQLRGELPKASDDIYSLGATIYELLTSKPPFFTGDLRHQVESVPAKPIAERLWELSLDNPIPAEVSALLLACLAKAPEQRPTNAGAVAKWIDLQIESSGTKHIEVQPATHSLATPETTPATTKPAEIDHAITPKPAHSPWLWVGGIAVVLVIGASSFLLRSKSPGPTPTTPEVVSAAKQIEPPKVVTATATNALTPEELAAATQPHDGSGRSTPGFPTGDGADGVIRSAAILSNNQILIAGNFTTFNGRSYNRVALLNPDASYNPTFVPGAGPDKEVTQALPLPDGKFLIAGTFEKVGDTSRRGVARLSANGSLDQSFDPGTGANGPVLKMWLQSDGKIILAGHFTKFNEQPRNYLVRLLADGSVDPIFNATGGPNDPVLSLWQLADGRLWIGGKFTHVNDRESPFLALLDANGKLLEASGTDGPVSAIMVLPDNSIIVGGKFDHLLGVERKNLGRLKTPGTVDASFKPGNGFDGPVTSLVPLPDGKLLVGGEFNRVDGQIRRGLARLKHNGELDAEMDARLNGAAKVNSVLLRNNGAVIVAGDLAPAGFGKDAKIAQIYGASPAPGAILQTKSFATAPQTLWVDTGFDVLKDSTYEILATGTVKLGDGTELTPDGQLQRPYAADIGAQGHPGHDPAHPDRSLIAQIGDGKLTMFIGRHQRFIAPSTGRLKLRWNMPPGANLKSQGQFYVTLRRIDLPLWPEPDWRFDVSARIDTTDELHLRYAVAQWVHKGGGAVVGRHNGQNYPTIINGICWWPQWDGPNSLPLRAPGLLYPYNKAGLKVLKVLHGRGTCTVKSQTLGMGQNGGPNYAVLEFKDGGVGERTLHALIGLDK